MANVIDYKKVEIHRAEKEVLKDVSFSIEEGEFCYLVGRVGSGKSSLLKSMYADVPVFSGEKAEVLDFDMLNIKKKQIPYLRRNIG
ncbi:MAG: ATP-binding cassette domain-containing protein, partial [Muribaculaceae bacterium]|nr:ATP-binding cassette domain-containing protein [Muribaculaceae bacterium]